MTIQQLQYILEVYRTASISMAAENLFISPVNLSNAVRSLEKELGFPIFIRSNRGVRCTEKGIRVIEQAGQIMLHHKKILSIQNVSSVSCRVGGLIYAPVREAYNKLCLEYSDKENIDLSYDIISFTEAVERLFLSTTDVAVSFSGRSQYLERVQKAESKGLRMQEIRRLPLVVRVGPRHPLYSKPDVRAEDFSRYIYVDSPNSSYLKNNEFLAAIRPNLNRIVRTASAESKLRLVAASDSMYSVGAQLPQYLNKRYGFRSIPVGNPDDYILSAVLRKENRSPVAGRYLQLLQEEMNSL